MNTTLEQYTLETSWSTRITDEIILEAIQGEIPFNIELFVLEAIADLNKGKISNKELYIKMFSILLKDKIATWVENRWSMML